jgi:hypothetical protein
MGENHEEKRNQNLLGRAKRRFPGREACTALDHQTAIRQYAAMPEPLTVLPLSFAWRWRRIKQRLHRG